MRILFALPGLHLYNRGAEVAFIAIANELAAMGEQITLFGSGLPRERTKYRFLHASSISRKRFEGYPSLPMFRTEFAFEDFTFVPGLLFHYRPGEYDLTVTCSFPFTNLTLRRPTIRGSRPPHVFVTQNGDWPAHSRDSEARLFGCEGLVCTNPDFFERNHDRWRCQLIPNGVDSSRFTVAPRLNREFGFPTDRLVVLMVSALDPSKRVVAGIEAVSRIPDAHLVVAGDGPLRRDVDEAAARLLSGRFTRLSVEPERMPALYRSADVFLHLSRDESFGNVFLEAMASGLPIVGYDTPRTRWIVGDQEYLFRSDDQTRVADQIELATKELTSTKQMRRLRAEQFSWPKIANRYRNFFREVIEGS